MADDIRRAIIAEVVEEHKRKHKAQPGCCTGFFCTYDMIAEAVERAFALWQEMKG